MSVSVADAPLAPLDVDVVARTDTLDRAAWLDLRRQGIGGSDAAAICGLDPWRTAFEVWCDKSGGAGPVEDRDSEAMEWGRRLEGVVAEAVAEREGVEMVELPALVAHRDRPWQLANIDRLVVFDGSLGVYEGKTAGHWTADGWDDGSVPDRHLAQGMHYLAVTGLDRLLYGCLIGGQRLVTRWVERDDDLIDHLIAAEARFWGSVQAATPPDPDGSKTTTDLLAHMWSTKTDSVLTVDDKTAADVRDLIAERSDAAAAEKTAAEAKARAENRLRLILGEYETLVDADGVQLARWPAIESSRLDVKALRAAHPEIAAEFTRPSISRRLTIPQRGASS